MHCFIDVIALWMWFEQDVYKRRILYNFLKIRMPLLYFCVHVYRCPLAGMLCLYYFNASMLKFAPVQFTVLYFISNQLFKNSCLSLMHEMSTSVNY